MKTTILILSLLASINSYSRTEDTLDFSCKSINSKNELKISIEALDTEVYDYSELKISKGVIYFDQNKSITINKRSIIFRKEEIDPQSYNRVYQLHADFSLVRNKFYLTIIDQRVDDLSAHYVCK